MPLSTIAKPPLLRITLIQLSVLLVSAVAAVPLGREIVHSVLAGGLVQVATSAYFARLAFRYQGARRIGMAVQAMYRGEMGKIVLSAVLFAVAFALVTPLDMLVMVAAYGALTVTHVLVSAAVLKHHRY